MSVATRFDFDWRPSRREAVLGAAVLNAELLALLVYLLVNPVAVQTWRYILYGLLWINVGLLAVAKTTPSPSNRRTRRLAFVVAVGYFLLLAVVGGLVSLAAGNPLATLLNGGAAAEVGSTTSVAVRMLPPGWGPAFVYDGAIFRLVLMPYKVVGYVALAYLVYATTIDAASASLSGVLGLFSCVSCAWPVLGSLVTSVFGSGSAVAVAATTWPYDLSTLAFLSAVALLYYRPTIGRGDGGE